MSNNKRFILLTVTIIIVLGLISYIPIYPVKINKLNIKILDEETCLPLEGILVYYKLETSGWRNVLGVPIIDPTDYDEVKYNKYFSNENGEIAIPPFKHFCKLYYEPYTVTLYINLDAYSNQESENYVDMENIFFQEYCFKHPDEKYINPNNLYKGCELTLSMSNKYGSSYKNVDKTENGLPYTEKDEYVILIDSGALMRDSNSYIIKLKKW